MNMCFSSLFKLSATDYLILNDEQIILNDDLALAKIIGSMFFNVDVVIMKYANFILVDNMSWSIIDRKRF